jgi:hypothetical protein
MIFIVASLRWRPINVGDLLQVIFDAVIVLNPAADLLQTRRGAHHRTGTLVVPMLPLVAQYFNTAFIPNAGPGKQHLGIGGPGTGYYWP